MPNSVQLDGITITLAPGFPVCIGGFQTWRYIVSFVSGPPTPGVSNFAFQLCNPQHIVTSFTPALGGVFDLNNAQPCLVNVGATRQMKWNVTNDNVVGQYEFTLQGCFVPTDINVALHTGMNRCFFGTITGPSCQPLTEGVFLQKTVTPTTGKTCQTQSQTYNVVLTISNNTTETVTGTLTDTILPPFSNTQTTTYNNVVIAPGGMQQFSYSVNGYFLSAGTFQFNTASFTYTTPTTGPTTITVTGPDIVVTECRGLKFS